MSKRVTVEVQQPNPPNHKLVLSGWWVILAGIVVAAILYVSVEKPKFLCGEINSGIDKPVWEFADPQSPVKILWQKSDIPALASYGFAISSTHVLVARGSIASICDNGSDVLSYKLKTGELDWHFAAPLVHWIAPTSGGYLLLYGDTVITKLNDAGRQIWFPPTLPSRSARILYALGDRVYLPVNSKTYSLLVPDRDIQEITSQEILGVFDNRLVFRDRNSGLRIVDENQKQVGSIALAHPIANDPTSPSFYLGSSGDNLLIFYGAERTLLIEAYQISTLKRLWATEKQFNSVPIIMGNHIVTFNDQQELEIIDARTGTQVSSIKFHRIVADDSDLTTLPVWLAGYDHFLAILFQSTRELVVLDLSSVLTPIH